jgi:putative membrane protein
MRLAIGIAACAALLAAGPVAAEDQPTGAGPAAAESGAPPPLRHGANSFMESQAREAIRKHGYENVSALVNDRDGIWRGTATKGQNTVQVSVDFKGHVDAR